MKELSKLNTGFFKRNLIIAKMATQFGKEFFFSSEKEVSNKLGRFLQNKMGVLTQDLGQLKGSLLKAGQILSLYGKELLPPEVENLLEELQSQSSFLSWNQISKQLTPKVLEELVISKKPIAAASIGQVHRSVLKNGDQVALKVQYPNMKEKIKSQLKLLNLLPVKGMLNPMKKWDIDLTPYLDMIQKKLDEELSYENEMSNQEKFGQMINEMKGVTVSTIYRSLSSDNLVVQSFEEGSFVDEVAKNWDQKQKNEAGSNLLNVFFQNLFKDGFLQGDCNIGNYLFRTSSKGKTEVVFIDFGNCVEIKKEVSLALWDLIHSVKRNENTDNYLELLVKIGFDREKLTHIKPQLSELLKIIFEPFLEIKSYDMSQWRLKERVDHTLGEKKWWFRSAGNTDFFEMMKSFFGVVNLLEILEAKISFAKS